MNKVFTLVFALLIFSFSQTLGQPSTVTVGSTTLDVREVIGDVDIPWEIQWGPDSHIWMTERFGRVSRLNPTTGVRTTILDLTSSVYASSESGLLGFILHPDFENTPQVFLAYTYYNGGIKERIVRYNYNSTSGMLDSPLTLIEGITGHTTHIGCRLLILPDNTMLATTGDYRNDPIAQDESSLSGKTLRMNLDGTIPSDNPFGPTSYLYSKGHRNAQGLVLAPNGKIYSSEHGPDSNDELNILVPGANYGWPEVEGFCNQGWETSWCSGVSSYEDPIAIWFEGSTIAPSDLVWYDHPAIPEWQGKMLMTVLKNKHLKEIEVDNIDGTSVVSEVIWFQNTFQRLRDILVAPDGRVFLATNGNSWSNTNPNTHSIYELKNSSYVPKGIDETNLTLETRIFPNPSAGDLNIVFDKKLVGGNFTITDRIGRTVFSGKLNAMQQNVDLSNVASGLYILQAQNDNYASHERILITE